MNVKLDKDFELIFKAVSDCYNWQVNNDKMHGNKTDFKKLAMDCAEIMKSEGSYRNLPEQCFGACLWIFDWNNIMLNFGFTSIFWQNCCDKLKEIR